jgi:competence protein ComEC
MVGQIVTDVDMTARGGLADFAWVDANGISRTSRLFLPPAPLIGRGDAVEVTGTVNGVVGETIFASGVRVTHRAGRIESTRRDIRDYITDVIEDRVPGTPGALTLGLLIGDDSALTEAERHDMRRAGLTHLTAVSGWNVSLVTSAVGLLCLRLGLRGWSWTALQLVALGGFVWVVGLEPPVTRAAIMAVAGLAAIRLGRPAHSVTVLTLAAALMVAISPESLTSLSFQLSIVATLGLVVAARLTQRFEGLPAVILTPIVATATIGIITAPLLAAETGSISLLTMPANLLAAPIVPIATIAGIAVVATSPISPVSTVAGWAASLLCARLLWLARILASVPYGYHEFAPLSGPAQAALYSVLIVAITLILPEGRLVIRAATSWVRREPLGAALSAGTACIALLTAAITV